MAHGTTPARRVGLTSPRGSSATFPGGVLAPSQPARGWDGPRTASAHGPTGGITRGARTHLRVTLNHRTVIEEQQALFQAPAQIEVAGCAGRRVTALSGR
jgi:hypothetical protein